MIRTTGAEDITGNIAEASPTPTGGCYNRAVRPVALTPSWLHLAMRLAGQDSPERPDGLRAAYLGGGHGFTPAVVADRRL